MRKSNPKIAFVMLGIACIATLFYFFILEPIKEKSQIINTIELANKSQFEAFQRLPIIDSTFLLKHYQRDGNAYKVILTLLKNNKSNTIRINQPNGNPSFQKVFSCKVMKLKSGIAIAKTSEHSFLKWYNTELAKYVVSYNEKNEQLYELIKERDKWKITHNYFEGKATPINY
ncbi:MAG: hypothetical protein ACI97P_001052 [Arcticibacterium sp.]